MLYKSRMWKLLGKFESKLIRWKVNKIKKHNQWIISNFGIKTEMQFLK